MGYVFSQIMVSWLRLFELNQRNFCIFFLQILLELCNISKWLKANTFLKQSSTKPQAMLLRNSNSGEKRLRGS